VPITIDKIEVRLDFLIYDVINFDLHLGYPLEKLLDASHLGPFSLRLQNLPLPKSTTWKKSFTVVKMNDHHPP
jgi:hypothetical protein